MKKKLDVLLVSAVVTFLFLSHAVLSQVADVDSIGSRVEVPESIEILLSNEPIQFPSLVPGGESNATTGGGFPLMISITENTNIYTNISINATDHFRDGVNWFEIENLTYSNVSGGGVNKSMKLTYNTTDPFSDWINIPPPTAGNNTTVLSYFWIRIPWAQAAGSYSTNIGVKGSKYGG
jgi:hypothetical protein